MEQIDAHKSETELVEAIEACADQVVIGGLYRHYKDIAHTYLVLDLVVNEADCSINVIYQAQYGARIKFDRPFSSFTSTVEVNGDETARFRKID